MEGILEKRYEEMFGATAPLVGKEGPPQVPSSTSLEDILAQRYHVLYPTERGGVTREIPGPPLHEKAFEVAKGVGEIPLALSGEILSFWAMAYAGYKGIGATLLEGPEKGKQTIEETQRKLREYLVYEPQTPIGRAGMGVVHKAFELFDNLADWAGEKTALATAKVFGAETGAATGAGVYGGIILLPLLLGPKAKPALRKIGTKLRRGEKLTPVEDATLAKAVEKTGQEIARDPQRFELALEEGMNVIAEDLRRVSQMQEKLAYEGRAEALGPIESALAEEAITKSLAERYVTRPPKPVGEKLPWGPKPPKERPPIIEEIKPSLEEAGEVEFPTFGETGKGIKGTIQRVYDAVDIVAPFARAGVEETGHSIRAFSSLRVAEQNRVLDVMEKIRPLKLSSEQKELIVLRAHRSIEHKLRPDLEQGAEAIRKYFDEATERIRKEGGGEVRWPQSQIERNLARIKEIEELDLKVTKKLESKAKLQEELQELRGANEKLKQMKYVHIPLDVWFDKIYEAWGGKATGIINQVFTRKFFRGRFFQQRKTVDIRELTDWLKTIKDPKGKPIFTTKDFSPENILASYAQKVGVIRGLARIFTNAKKEKLIVSADQRPPNYVNPPLELTIRFPELKGKVVHEAFLDYMMSYIDRKAPTLGQQILRPWAYFKIKAFWNPVILPAYDMWQASWIMAFTNPLKVPKWLAKGFKSAWKRDETFYRALEDGAISEPVTPPFENFRKTVEASAEGNLLKRVAKDYLSVKIPILDSIYKAIYRVAWFGDRGIRMASYYSMLERGFSPKEAARLVAEFHADYARIKPKPRYVATHIMFTPLFKYCMGLLQARMIKGSVKVIKNAMKMKKPATRDLMYAKGLVSLVGGMLALRYLLQHWGFEEEAFSYRYSRKATIKGKQKEIVATIPTPANVFIRQVYKWGRWGPDPAERIDEIINKAHWDLHPIWATAVEILNNRGMDGKEIYHILDLPSHPHRVANDVMSYMFKRLYSIMREIEKVTVEEKREALETLQKDIGVLDTWFLKSISIIYARQPAEIRYARKAQQLLKQFRSEVWRNAEEMSPEEFERWRKNLQTRVKKIVDFMEEQRKKEQEKKKEEGGK